MQQYKNELSRITGAEYRDVHTFEEPEDLTPEELQNQIQYIYENIQLNLKNKEMYNLFNEKQVKYGLSPSETQEFKMLEQSIEDFKPKFQT